MKNPQSPQAEPEGPVTIIEKISKKNGEILEKKYLKGAVLGKGGFATCYEMTDTEKNKLYAVKVVLKSSLTKKRALEKLLAEIKIHKSLQHPNVVSFEHVFEDKENVYILLEICPNQTLKELLKAKKRLNEADCAMYTVQIIKALQYLHSQKIIHRDLKLGNLLLGEKMEIKVADFGLAAKVENDGEKRRTICGTPNYLAPEVLDKKQGHSYEVDVWGLGVICYTLLVGRPPFETNDTKTTYRKILKAEYQFPGSVNISEHAKDLIKRILVIQPEKRPTFAELLEHPFLKAYADKFIAKANRESLAKISTTKLERNTLNIPSTHTREGSPSRDIDEKEIYYSSLMKSEQPKHSRVRSYDHRQDSSSPGGKSSTANKKRKLRFNLKPDYDNHIVNWVDYSSKYGMGYMVADGTVGIVFKDLSRITLAPNGQKFEYTKRLRAEIKEFLLTFGIDEYPQELKKKVELVKYFKNYLQQQNGNANNVSDSQKSSILVYVKKWTQTKHATIFRLSNNVVQVVFDDNTQIILSPNDQIAAYKNKAGEFSYHPLEKISEGEVPELTKRLKYIKDLVAYIENANKDVIGGHNYRASMGNMRTNINLASSPVLLKVNN